MNIPLLGLLLNRYPVDVEIWEPRAGGGFFIRNEKGRRKQEKDGKWEYELKHLKEKTKPVSTKYIYYDSSGRTKLKLFSEMPGVYQPMEVKSEDGKEGQITVMSEDTRRYITMKAQDIFLKYQAERGFLEKYGALVAMVPFCILVITILILMGGNFEHIAQAASQVASAFEKVAQTMDMSMFGPPI